MAPPSSSSSAPISHAYTSLLSTLHERSSLLAAPSGSIPPSLNRTLKRQIDSFAKAVQDAQSRGNLDKKDAQSKWDRIQESVQRDEQGRLALVSAKDSHPILSSLGQEAAAEESSEVPARNAGSDEPYRDSPSRPSSPLEDPQDHHQLMQDQRKIFDQQDSQLDTLSLSIGRQRDLSLRMNEELELQSDLLDDLDQDVERTGLRLGRASGQLDRVRRKVKDHGSLCALFGLIILLVALIILFK